MITREQIEKIIEKVIQNGSMYFNASKELEDAVNAIMGLIGQSQWQPIETAPKDKEILVCAKWVGVSRAWYSDGDGWLSSEMSNKLEPTHWMLLPEKPK